VNNRFSLDASLDSTWYLDPPQGTGEFQNTGGVNLNYFRRFSERLSIVDSLHLSHETQPNFQIGVSITRPTGGYFMGAHSLSAEYKWSTRFSTITGWSTTAISYEDHALRSENYSRQVFSEKFRYALTQRTAASLEYRFSFANYPDNPAAESQSNFLLLGIERPLGRFLSMTLSAGSEWRAYDGSLGNRTEPVVEAAIDYRARENTTFRWYYRSGLEDTGSAGRQSSFSRRTGLVMTHKFPVGISLNLAVNSLSGDLSSGGASTAGTGDTFEASAGLSYYHHLWRRFGFNASYSYSMINSDDELSEYRRHQAALGISAQF
jgi:hypothetical protein